MEPNPLNIDASSISVPLAGNPLLDSSSQNTAEQTVPITATTSSVLSANTTDMKFTEATITSSEPISLASPTEQILTPLEEQTTAPSEVFISPTPIQSGVEPPTIIDAPKKSNVLGIVIGILFLISMIVGASLYYYFFIFSKDINKKEATPAPVTLIKQETPPNVDPVPIVPIPATSPVDNYTSLSQEIDTADQSLASTTETNSAAFDQQVK